MIPLLKSFVHDLLYSEERVTLWARGFLTWLGLVGALVVAKGEAALTDWRTWGVAAIGGAAVLFKAGDKNKPLAPPNP